MIIPIRCFTCGKVMADKNDYYMKKLEELNSKNIEKKDILYKNFDNVHSGEILNDLGLIRYCCRRNLISNVDLMHII